LALGLMVLCGIAPIFTMVGCDSSGTNPPIIKAPPAAPGKEAPLPADPHKGGGPGSSGNMKGEPGGPY
jgi:hypothetical protein